MKKGPVEKWETHTIRWCSIQNSSETLVLYLVTIALLYKEHHSLCNKDRLKENQLAVALGGGTHDSYKRA